MRVIGKKDLLEPLNRSALKIAKKCSSNTQRNETKFNGSTYLIQIFGNLDKQSQLSRKNVYRND